MNNSSSSSVPGELLALQKAFVDELPGRVASIKKLWEAFRQQLDSEERADELYRMVHNLAGAGGTFGVMTISHVAHDLELAIKVLRNDKSDSLENHSVGVQNLIDQLQEVASNCQPSAVPYLQQASPNQPAFTHPFNNLVYLVDDDMSLGSILVDMLKENGYEPVYFNTSAEFQQRWSSLAPAGAIIMDMVFEEGAIAGAETIQALREKWGILPPVIFVSVRNDFESRFAAIKAGANRYFCKPLNYIDLCQTLDGLTGRLIIEPYRALLIDDDESVLEFHASLLREQGIEVETLTDPCEALNVMAAFQPELVILDVYIPVCSGLELATIIRQDEKYAQMPIVFLSSELDFGKHLDALDLGGDEFLTKSISAEHFVIAITARLKKARWASRVSGQLRDALKQSEYQQIALNIHGIVSITDPSGIIIHVNDKFCDSSGYDRDELIGQSIEMIMSDHHTSSFYADMRSTIESGNIFHDVFCNRNKLGNRYWVDSTIVPFLDEKGKPYQYVSVGTDITSLKNIQKNLVTTMEQVEQANEAKSQFLANMSHEFRTPLNGILGFAQIMQMNTKYPLNEDHLNCAKRIEAAGYHLLKLINEILDLAAVESGNIEISSTPLLIETVIEECRQLISPSLTKYEIELDFNAELSGRKSVQADPTRLRQILLNLLSNACKYNKRGGKITINYQSTDNNALRINILDTGNGIAPDKQSELFKPFSRLGAENSGIEGTGIGLTYCKKLVELMNGRIGFESQQGKGSIFWIELPEGLEVTR